MSYWYVVLIAIIFVVILFLSLKSSGKQEPSPAFVCGINDHGNYPNSSDCSSFFLCAAGQTIQLFCSSGFLYDIHERNCVVADRVDCGDRPVR